MPIASRPAPRCAVIIVTTASIAVLARFARASTGVDTAPLHRRSCRRFRVRRRIRNSCVSFRPSAIRARFICCRRRWRRRNGAGSTTRSRRCCTSIRATSIVFETMMHSHNQVVPGTTIEQIKKLRTDFPGRGPHTLTGPVYIEGAEPGDVLKVTHQQDRAARLRAPTSTCPACSASFPTSFPRGRSSISISISTARSPSSRPGIEIPLAPFPGTHRRRPRRARPVQLGAAGTLRGQYRHPRPDRRRNALRPGIRQGRAALDRRFARRAGQRRDQSHRARDRLQGNERHGRRASRT